MTPIFTVSIRGGRRVMLAVALLFVGITLISNGYLFLKAVDVKSIAIMNIITAIVLIGGNFIVLSQATTMMEYSNAGGGFLFGFTYAIIAAGLLFNVDKKVSGIYSLMVAIFAIIMGVSAVTAGSFNYAYLWFAWAILWGATVYENILEKSLEKKMSYLCIAEGIFAAFIPAMLMFFDMF